MLCTMAGTGYGAFHSIGMTSSSHAGQGSTVLGQGSPGGTFSIAIMLCFKQHVSHDRCGHGTRGT